MENFIHLFNSGGFVMYPLLILSLITLAIAVERFYFYRNNRKGSKTFFHGVYHAAAAKDWDVVRQLCTEFPSALSRVIANGMAHDTSEASMKSAFEDRMSMESISFHRYLDYLSAIPIDRVERIEVHAGRSADEVTPVTTEEYYSGQEGIAPRPLISTLDLSKIETIGFTPADSMRRLEEYVSALLSETDGND